MNARQAAFFRQARSDWSAYRAVQFRPHDWNYMLRKVWCGVVGIRLESLAVCHELHYLQMCSEKLAKAYFPTDPRTGHAAFRSFMRDLLTNARAIMPLGFASTAELTRWGHSVRYVVGAIEDLAPAIADKKNLPNPEYPWPKPNPTTAPADYPFTTEVYVHLNAQQRSGEPPFLRVLGRMIETMQTYQWHL